MSRDRTNRQTRSLGKFPRSNDETDLSSNSIEKGEGASATIKRVQEREAAKLGITHKEYLGIPGNNF